jgi:hypothetical protein
MIAAYWVSHVSGMSVGLRKGISEEHFLLRNRKLDMNLTLFFCSESSSGLLD